ncbi:MAG: DNA-binding response regulator [Nitrospirae bacterium]|nr:MAG: DNA-binding response regulator [Nitrospirota bacterium]
MEVKRILIADDHTIVREGIKQILTDRGNCYEVDEASDGHEALKKINSRSYDLLILDISMPGLNGLDALKQIKYSHPELPVLILSMYPERQYAIRVLRAGASGYLGKDSAPELLFKAIDKILAGGKFISESLAERLAVELVSGGERLPHERLSDREYQVFSMIASGMSLSEIADKLALSVKTVSTYRARILEKMGLRNNAEIIHYAIKNNLIN